MTDDTPAGNGWSTEYYGFADHAAPTPPAAARTTSAGQRVAERPAHRPRGRAVLAVAVLGLVLAAGAGGFTLANAATVPDQVGVVEGSRHGLRGGDAPGASD
ncbi:MAG: hypothetical protein WB441_01015 [Nocardioidaceae bacterium]